MTGGGARWPSPVRAWSVVMLLAMLYCLSFIDRMILTLLVGPLKADLGLTDTQLGLLHGLAFAMFYATLGYPLGLLADRISRKWLIMTGVLLWVSMTALSAFAQSFWTLFLCRMGLGLGEAALSPAALSLIADYFRPQMRARAASVFITGASVGGALAVMVGGWLAGVVGQGGSVHLPVFGDLRTWQLTLLAVSAPGFVLGLLVMLIREPPRRQSVETQQTSGILAYLRYRRRLLSFHIGGMGLCAVCTYAFSMWIPTLLIRELGWTPIDVAGLYGPALLVASVVGMIGGGMLADRGVRAGDPGRTLKIAFWSMILLMISAILITIVARDTMSMMASLALFNMAGAAPFGVSLAALLATTPNRFRGQITALYLFGLTFGGFAVGPPLAGLFSDHLFPASSGLAHALALLAALSLPLAAVLLGCAIKPYRAAVEDLKLWENLPAEADSGASAAPTSIS